MLKTLTLGLGFFLFGQTVYSYIGGIECKLSRNCPVSLETIECEVSVPPGGYCIKIEKPASVTCKSYYENDQWYDTDQYECINNNNGNNPEICDISDPVYWLYCDTFPAY